MNRKVNHPCGKCGKGVKNSAVLCSMYCKTWFHTKCIGMADSDFKQICNGHIQNWSCTKCTDKEGKDYDVKINELNEKIIDLSMSDSLDPETSLQLVAEAGSLLLKEKNMLQEEVYKLKGKNSELKLALEDKEKEFGEEMHTLSENSKVKDKEFQQTIKALQYRLTKDNNFKDDLLRTMEHDMSDYVARVNMLNNTNKSLNDEIKALKNKLREAETNIKHLRNEIETFTSVGHGVTMNKTNSDLPSQIKSVETQTDIQFQPQGNTNRENIQELLRTSWIKDDVIKIYFELLNEKLLKDASIMCMNPTICQAVKMSEDTNCFLTPLGLKNFQYVIIPVNDGAGTDSEDGSHWSLLVCKTVDKSFYYFDSVKDYNLSHAKKIAKKIFAHLNPSIKDEEPVLTVCQTPQQSNSYDCGIYVLAITDIIINHLMRNPTTSLGKIQLPELNKSDLLSKRSLLAYVLNNRAMMNAEELASVLVTKSLHCSNINMNQCNSVWSTVKIRNRKDKNQEISTPHNNHRNVMEQPHLKISNNFDILYDLEVTNFEKADSNLKYNTVPQRLRHCKTKVTPNQPSKAKLKKK